MIINNEAIYPIKLIVANIPFVLYLIIKNITATNISIDTIIAGIKNVLSLTSGNI